MFSKVLTAFRNVFGFAAGSSREQVINQICLLIFVPAAIVVLGLIELQQFALRFWISLALVAVSLLVSTQRLQLFLVLSAFVTLRFGIALLAQPDITRLLGTLLSAGFTFIFLRMAVSREGGANNGKATSLSCREHGPSSGQAPFVARWPETEKGLQVNAPLDPTFPLTVRYSEDGEELVLNSLEDVIYDLEWFDSENPGDRASVWDAEGRAVRLKIEALEIIEISLKKPESEV